MLSSPTATPLFLSSSIEGRAELVDMFDSAHLLNVPEKSVLIQLIGQEPYTRLDKQVHDDRLLEIYNYITLNKIDHLRELIQNAGITGLAHLRFNFFDLDEDVLTLSSDKKITISEINPILLAVKSKSFDCLTYMVNTFGIRQSMGPYP